MTTFYNPNASDSPFYIPLEEQIEGLQSQVQSLQTWVEHVTKQLDQQRHRTETAEKERDEAREHGTYKYTKWVEDQWNQAISERETAERERDEARAALREIYEGAAGNSGRCMDCDSIAQVAARTLTPI